MNTALAKFMSVAVTAVIMVGLVFGVAYKMVQDKSDEHENHIYDLQIQEFADL